MKSAGEFVPPNPPNQTVAGTKSRWSDRTPTETTTLRPAAAPATERSKAGEPAIQPAAKKSRWSKSRPNNTTTLPPPAEAPGTTQSTAGNPAIGSHRTSIVPTAGAATYPSQRPEKKSWIRLSGDDRHDFKESLVVGLICLASGGPLLGVGIWQLSVGKAKQKEAKALQRGEAGSSQGMGLVMTILGGILLLPGVIGIVIAIRLLVSGSKNP